MENLGGRIAVRVAAIAVTFIIFIASVVFLALRIEAKDSEKYDSEAERNEKNANEYIGRLSELMEIRDYTEIYIYYRQNNIYFAYDSEYREYNDVCYVADYFNGMLESLVSIDMHSTTLESTMNYGANSLAWNINKIEEMSAEKNMAEKNYSEFVSSYMRSARTDAENFLKYYLKLNDEEVSRMASLSEDQIEEVLKEAIKNAW